MFISATSAAVSPGPGFQDLGRRMAHLGILGALVALLKSSASYWPGGGHLLAALSSLPVALGCLLVRGGAFFMLVVPAGLLFMLSVHEALIFVFTTAPVGILAGWAASSTSGARLRWLLPGVGLGSGLLVTARVIKLPALGPAVGALGPLPAALVYLGFGFAYAAVWVWIICRWGRRWLGLLVERADG